MKFSIPTKDYVHPKLLIASCISNFESQNTYILVMYISLFRNLLCSNLNQILHSPTDFENEMIFIKVNERWSFIIVDNTECVRL